MKLFSGTSNEQFAESLSSADGVSLGKREVVRFSDGEIRIRLEEDVSEEKVVFVQSFAFGINDYLMESLLFLDTLKTHGAKEMWAIFPYLPYARQNQEHRPGEGVSARTVAALFQSVGVQKLFTYDVHALNTLEFFSIPTINIPILPVLLERLLADTSLAKEEVVVVAPDQDGAKRAKQAAEIVHLAHGFVEKERDLDKVDELKTIHGQKVSGDVLGKTVILADDMIVTGSTLLQAAQYVRESGATEVYAIATHGIFTRGISLFNNESIKKIYISDSIVQQFPSEKILIVSTVQHAAKILTQP